MLTGSCRFCFIYHKLSYKLPCLQCKLPCVFTNNNKDQSGWSIVHVSLGLGLRFSSVLGLRPWSWVFINHQSQTTMHYLSYGNARTCIRHTYVSLFGKPRTEEFDCCRHCESTIQLVNWLVYDYATVVISLRFNWHCQTAVKHRCAPLTK